MIVNLLRQLCVDNFGEVSTLILSLSQIICQQHLKIGNLGCE